MDWFLIVGTSIMKELKCSARSIKVVTFYGLISIKVNRLMPGCNKKVTHT